MNQKCDSGTPSHCVFVLLENSRKRKKEKWEWHREEEKSYTRTIDQKKQTKVNMHKDWEEKKIPGGWLPFLIRSTRRNPLVALFLCSSRTPGKERKKSKKDTDKRRSSYTRRIDKKCKIKLTKHKGREEIPASQWLLFWDKIYSSQTACHCVLVLVDSSKKRKKEMREWKKKRRSR